MSGGSEKNGDVAAGEEEAWRGGGGVVISQKAALSSSVVAVDGIYRHLPLSLFQTLLSITKCCSGHNLPVRFCHYK